MLSISILQRHPFGRLFQQPANAHAPFLTEHFALLKDRPSCRRTRAGTISACPLS